MARSYRFISGWRASAVTLLFAAILLTIVLCSLLLVSLFKLGNGWASLGGNSLLFTGSCITSSRLNLGLHLLINIMGSGVLASSNFFMQILLAPTRRDVDRAHRHSQFAEIGVQSFRNLKIVPLSNVSIWILLAITSVPLHLVFNSSILETKGSTKLKMVVASEGFIKGSAYVAPGVGDWEWYEVTNGVNATLADIRNSLSNSTWERLNLKDCWHRYNNTGATLSDHRHFVLVVSNVNEAETETWTAREVRYNSTEDRFPEWILDMGNSLWFVGEFDRTDNAAGFRTGSDAFDDSLDSFLSDLYWRIDFNTKILTSDTITAGSSFWYPYYNDTAHNPYNEPYQNLTAQYCLSQPITIPCRLEVENTLLAIVCIVCLVKCTLCIVILAKLRNTRPFATPGDALESFILHPDSTTKGMCGFSRKDFVAQEKAGLGWQAMSKSLEAASRRATSTVPMSIWLWSYFLISLSIGTGLFFFIRGIVTRPL
jgi:hypothetical protein